MQLDSVKFNTYKPLTQSVKPQTPQTDNDTSTPKFETSIYKQKGVTIPFCAWAKGLNEVEEECIKLFRKARENRCRKYTEPEIIEFMNIIREGHKGKDQVELVKTLFELDGKIFEKNNDFSKIFNPRKAKRRGRPKVKEPKKDPIDAKLINNILNTTKNRSEQEYYAVLEFANHELNAGAVEPLGAFVNLAPEYQNKFLKLMTEINSINDMEKCPTIQDIVDKDTMFNLYENLRHAIYMTEDLPKLDAQGKLDYYIDIHSAFKNLRDNPPEHLSERAKQNTRETMQSICDTAFDILNKDRME